jgi:hypothetical protein
VFGDTLREPSTMWLRARDRRWRREGGADRALKSGMLDPRDVISAAKKRPLRCALRNFNLFAIL